VITQIAAKDVKTGHVIGIKAPGCSFQPVGSVIADAQPIAGQSRKVSFRVQYSPTYSGSREHWADTKVWIDR